MNASTGHASQSDLAGMDTPPIVSGPEWEAAREGLLAKEKALTAARDALAAERRRMPWLRVDKDYAFEGHNGAERREPITSNVRPLRTSRSRKRTVALRPEEG